MGRPRKDSVSPDTNVSEGANTLEPDALDPAAFAPPSTDVPEPAEPEAEQAVGSILRPDEPRDLNNLSEEDKQALEDAKIALLENPPEMPAALQVVIEGGAVPPNVIASNEETIRVLQADLLQAHADLFLEREEVLRLKAEIDAYKRVVGRKTSDTDVWEILKDFKCILNGCFVEFKAGQMIHDKHTIDQIQKMGDAPIRLRYDTATVICPNCSFKFAIKEDE